MNERRFECRFLCADVVKVEWLDGHSPGAGKDDLRTVEAVLEDISTLGACVQVEEHIPPGTAISISACAGRAGPEWEKPAQLSGHVSYCVYRDYGYFVGIRFSNETKWSSGVFEPQHLTNLGTLLISATTTES